MGGFFGNGQPAFNPAQPPIALGSTGQVLTVASPGVLAFAAASGGSGLQVASVPADEAYGAGTVPVNDAHLVFSSLAAGYYALILAASFWCNNTSQLSFTVNTTGTVTERFCQSITGSDAATTAFLQSFQTGTTAMSSVATSGLGSLSLHAMIAFSSSANSIAFAWAPTTNGATANIRGGSWALLAKVG